MYVSNKCMCVCVYGTVIEHRTSSDPWRSKNSRSRLFWSRTYTHTPTHTWYANYISNTCIIMRLHETCTHTHTHIICKLYMKYVYYYAITLNLYTHTPTHTHIICKLYIKHMYYYASTLNKCLHIKYIEQMHGDPSRSTSSRSQRFSSRTIWSRRNEDVIFLSCFFFIYRE